MTFLKKNSAAILFILSIIAVFICLNYRANDYMSAASLFLILGPVLIVQLFFLVTHYISKTASSKKTALYILWIGTGFIWIVLFVYIFKYN